MARKPRFNIPGSAQHVIQRGNNRSACFFTDADYRVYLESLREARETCDCDIHAYVLMTNHVHLLVTPRGDHGVSRMMQSLGRRYVRYFNKRHCRTGTLWEGRYRSSLVDTGSYVLACYRYIEFNPVRAGLVGSPGDYRWSSHRAVAFGQPDGLVTLHDALLNLGSDDTSRRKAYRGLFEAPMTGTELDEIRLAVNREGVLGSEVFKRRLEQKSGRRIGPGKPGRPPSAKRLLG
jgi:putative transposase